MSVPVGQWHALESLESGSVILETKDGANFLITVEDVLSVWSRPIRLNTIRAGINEQVHDVGSNLLNAYSILIYQEENLRISFCPNLAFSLIL